MNVTLTILCEQNKREPVKAYEFLKVVILYSVVYSMKSIQSLFSLSSFHYLKKDKSVIYVRYLYCIKDKDKLNFIIL